jgi:hypothetical protein
LQEGGEISMTEEKTKIFNDLIEDLSGKLSEMSYTSRLIEEYGSMIKLAKTKRYLSLWTEDYDKDSKLIPPQVQNWFVIGKHEEREAMINAFEDLSRAAEGRLHTTLKKIKSLVHLYFDIVDKEEEKNVL